MSLRDAIAKVVWWNNEMEERPCPGGGGLGSAMDTMEEIAAQSPAEAWDIFTVGTDEEFAVLVNSVADIGKEFETDTSHREIMKLAKQRGTPDVLQATRAGFGALFDRFWNETEPAPVGKARTFNQVLQPTGT
ncbi:MAG: hypothetical protein FWB96_05785 [Defluviitaleaceae bacterium]|nr:hypothetical protein [Defluviitaleaceae bacterium]MCL2262319.1 hypothetical protein [Defluviitaleaceae bacterium]